MQIKIEIDVRPDELRRFIGLPDVAGLQDDVIQFVREKLHQAGENFDAGAFVKSNLKLLSRSPLLGKLFTPSKGSDAARTAEASSDDGGDPPAAESDKSSPESHAAGKSRRRARAKAGRKTARKKAATRARSSA